MKTTTLTIMQPILMVDSHHGIYAPKIFMEQLSAHYKKQIPAADRAVLRDIENDLYFDVWEDVSSIVFKTETGQKLHVYEHEGDIYLVPACFLRTAAGKEFTENI